MSNAVEEQGMATPVDTPAEPGLNALDRCDRCGGQAYVRTRHHLGKHPDAGPDSTDLLWCAHHYREHQDVLSEFVVLDERSKLAPTT